MKEFIVNNKKKILLISILLLLSFTIIISFGYFSNSHRSESFVFSSNKCLKVEITTESNAINLEKEYPITDKKGLEKDTYTFTIKNTCSEDISYEVNLESLYKKSDSNVDCESTSTEEEKLTCLSDNYNVMNPNDIKVSISKIVDIENINLYSNTKVIDLNDKNKTRSNIDNNTYKSYSSNNLYKEYIEEGGTRTFEIRLWMDYEATKEAADKVYYSKINIVGFPAGEVSEETTYIAFDDENGNLTAYLIDEEEHLAIYSYCFTKNSICMPDETDFMSAASVDDRLIISGYEIQSYFFNDYANYNFCVKVDNNDTNDYIIACATEELLKRPDEEILAESGLYIAPKNGYYTIYAFGAQGGNSDEFDGGYGGYTSGWIYLTKGEELFIDVSASGDHYSGGGATRIYKIDEEGNEQIIMIAAGGGAASDNNGPGGAGGEGTGLGGEDVGAGPGEDGVAGAGGGASPDYIDLYDEPIEYDACHEFECYDEEGEPMACCLEYEEVCVEWDNVDEYGDPAPYCVGGYVWGEVCEPGCTDEDLEWHCPCEEWICGDIPDDYVGEGCPGDPECACPDAYCPEGNLVCGEGEVWDDCAETIDPECIRSEETDYCYISADEPNCIFGIVHGYPGEGGDNYIDDEYFDEMYDEPGVQEGNGQVIIRYLDLS